MAEKWRFFGIVLAANFHRRLRVPQVIQKDKKWVFPPAEAIKIPFNINYSKWGGERASPGAEKKSRDFNKVSTPRD